MLTRSRATSLTVTTLFTIVILSTVLSYKSEGQLEIEHDRSAGADSGLTALLQGQIIRSNPSGQSEAIPSRPTYPALSNAVLALTGNIAFETNRTGIFDVYAKNADGSSAAVPLVASSGNDVTPMWSSDGTQMLFASDRDGDFDICLRIASGEERDLTQNTANDGHPSWSPAGDRIIFTSDRGGGYFQIYTMRTDGTDVQQVGVVPDNNAMYPRYSPDGSRIAFMRASITLPLCEWNWDVWMMDADGGNQQRVTTFLGGDLYPNWTPDGTEIIYASCRNFFYSDLYAVNPDTMVERQINSWFLSNEWGAIYSPDAEHLAFNTDRDGNIEIYITSAVGGTASNFTQNNADDLAASWGSQGAPATYSISGRVADAGNSPIPGVTISDGRGHAATTDSEGDYVLRGLAAGTYTLTPAKDDYIFTPISLLVSVPPDATEQDFTGEPPPCDLSKQPVLLIHGWHGGATSLQDDEQLGFFIDYLGTGYTENCNLWYAQGVSEDNRLHQNAERIQATLRQAYDHIITYNPSFDGHFDIIAHSMGGINSRAYLESDLYKDDQNYRGGIHVDNLFTLGTPHGGAGDVPTALLFAALALREDFWGDLPSVGELTPLYMLWFNLRHRQPDGVCYRLLGGDINEQIPFLGKLYPPPNDLLVSRYSAHFLGYLPFSLKWPRTVKEYLPDMHGYKWYLRFLRSYVQPRNTFDECIKDYLDVSGYSCSSSSSTALETTASAESTPTSYRMTPFVTGIITTGQSLTGTLAIDSSGHTGFYLAWYEGDLDFTLVAPDTTVVNTTTAEADPNVSFLALDALLSTEIYAISNTLTGTWAFTVTAVTLPYTMPYAVYAVLDTPINLALSTGAEWYPGGSPVAITATLMYSATALTDATVQAEVSRPDGATETIALLDDGAHNDGAADDGVYGGQYSGTTVGGYYGAIATASGSYASQDYQRSAQAIFAVSPGTASFSGTYSDHGEDGDSNGLYEYLVVQVGLDVIQAGDYSLAAVLEGTGDQYIDHAMKDITLGAGSQVVTLRFDGDAIRGSGLDGPYTVTQVLLTDNSEIAVKLDEAHDVWITAAYDHRQFGSAWRIYLPLILRDG